MESVSHGAGVEILLDEELLVLLLHVGRVLVVDHLGGDGTATLLEVHIDLLGMTQVLGLVHYLLCARWIHGTIAFMDTSVVVGRSEFARLRVAAD